MRQAGIRLQIDVRTWTRALAALALLAATGLACAQTVLEVIPLKHRTPEDLIPILQPMIARDGSITGTRGQLIVRTTPANLQELKRILAKIDLPPRRVMITVAQYAAADARARGGDVSGNVRADEHVRFGTGGSGPRDEVRARIYDTRSLDNATVTQTVQAIEGRTALIQMGRSVPVVDGYSRSVTGGRVVGGRIVGGRLVQERISDGVDYRDARTGFLVTPRLVGDRVTLEIAPQREVFVEGRPAALDVQRVTTTVSGRLGEWIEVAVASQERGSDRSELLGRAGDMRSESRSVLLKVDEIR